MTFRWRKWSAVTAALAAAVLLLAALVHLAPVRARVLAAVAGRVRAQLGIDLAADRLDYNLLTLSVRLVNVRLTAATVRLKADTTDDAATNDAATGDAAAGDEGETLPPFFEADAIAVDLPWSVIAGGLAIESIDVSRPRVTIVRDARGAFNLPVIPERDTSGPPLERLPIGRLAIRDGEVTYLDETRELAIDARGLAIDLRGGGAGATGTIGAAGGVHVRYGSRETATTRLEGRVGYDGRSLRVDALQVAAPEADLQARVLLPSLFSEPQVEASYDATLRLARIAGWLPIEPAPAGTLRVSGAATGALADPEITLKLTAEDLAWRDLRGASVSASAKVSAAAAQIDSLVITSADGVVSASGRVPFGESEAGRARLEWRNLDLGVLVGLGLGESPLRLAARLEGRAEAEWWEARLDAVRLTLENTSGSTRAPSALGLDGRASLRLDRGAWTLEHDHVIAASVRLAGVASGRLDAADLAASTLAGRATVAAANLADAAARLRAAGLPLDALASLDLAGEARAELALAGALGDPIVDGSIEAARLSVGGAPEMRLLARVHATTSRVEVPAVELRAGANLVEGSLVVDLAGEALDGEWRGDLPALGELAATLPERWRPSGAATLSGRVGGTFARPVAEAAIVASNLDVAGQRVDRLEARARLVGPTLEVESFEAAQPTGGRLSASGRYDLDTGRYAVKLRGSDLRASSIPGTADADAVPLDVAGDIQFEGEGAADRPSGRGTLELRRLAWAGADLGPTRATVTLTEGVATVEAVAGEIDAVLQGTVALFAPRAFDLTGGLADADLARLYRLVSTDEPHIGGIVSLGITASGRLDELADVTAVIDLQRFEARHEEGTLALARPAAVRYENSTLTAEAVELRAGGTSLTLSSSLTREEAGGRLDLRLDGDLADLRPFVPALADREGLEMSGVIALRATATGSLDRPEVTADLTVQDGHVAVAGLPPARALGFSAAYRDGVLDLTGVRGVWQGAVIVGSGRVPARILEPWLPESYLDTLPAGDATARVTMRVAPITRAALEPWVKPETLAQLDVAIGATLTLEADRPEIDGLRGDLVFDRLSLLAARVPIAQQRPTRLTLADGRLRVADWAWSGAGTEIEVGGEVGLDDGRLDLQVRGTSDLRVVGAFVPGVATGGTAALDVRVRGRADDPELDGQIAITDGELRVRAPRVAVTNLAGTVALMRDRLVVRDISGAANGGTIQFGGEMRYDRLALQSGEVSLVGRRIALDVPEGLRTETDADLKLVVVVGESPLVTGRVVVQRGAYRDPIVLTGRALEVLRAGAYVPEVGAEPSMLDRIHLDVAVETATDIVVDNNYGRINLGADLRLGGTLGRPALGGRATLGEGGQVFLGGNTYRIERGTVDFVDPSGIKPDLNFTARTRVASHDITLNVTGTPETIKAELTSDEGLSQADVVSLLVTGRTLAEAGGAQTEMARDQALRYLSGDLLGFAGRAVGVDSVRLTQGTPDDTFGTDPSLLAAETDPAARLTVAKSLSRQVEIILSQSLRESGGLTWIAIYRPIPNLEVRGVSRDDGTRSYETFHQVTFGGGRRVAGSAPRDREPRVSEVRLTGTIGVIEAEIRSRLDVGPGDRFDFFKWQQDRERVQRFYEDRGFYEARVAAAREEPGDGTVALSYAIDQGPRTELDLQGYTLPGSVQRELRDRWAGAVFDGFLLEDMQAAVKAHLARDGYLRATVSAEVRRREAPEDVKTIVIGVEAGPRTATRTLAFSGNERVSADRLRGVVRERGLELTAWLAPAEVEAALAAFYRAEGMLDARVRAGAPRFEGDTATLPFAVDEGPAFLVSEVRVEGAKALTESTVRDAFGIAAGARYEPARFEEARQRVERAYRARGFNAVRVQVASVVARESGGVGLSVAVDEGPRQVLADVTVEGARRTRGSVIDRALDAEPGAPVDLESWYQARKRLYDTGVFRSADIEFEPTGAPVTGDGPDQLVCARVTLDEWPVWRLRYGFRLEDQVAPSGEGRDLSPGLLVDLQHRNLFGRAMRAGITASYQADLEIARGFVSLPRLLTLPVRTNIFLTRSRRTLNQEGVIPFIEDKSILSAEQQFDPIKALKVTYGYRYERNHTFDPDLDPNDPFALDFTINVARLNAAAVVDTRNDPFDSTSGWFHASNLEYAAESLGSDLRFVKYLAQQYYFRQLGPVTLASAARFGAVRGLDQEVILSERFFSGGGTSVRGYREDSLGPTGFFGDPSGGNALIVINEEVRVPVYRWVRAVGFLDAGNVFPRIRDVSFGDLKVSVGAGVRLDTPFALVRIDFGVPLSRPEGEPRGRWYFSFGHIF